MKVKIDLFLVGGALRISLAERGAAGQISFRSTALVVSRSRSVNPLHGDLVLSGVSICASPKFDILCVKFGSKLPFEDHVRGIMVSRAS